MPERDVVFIARCPVHGLHGARTTCFAYEHEGARDCDGIVEQVAMQPLDTSSDPRAAAGAVVGPGGPFDEGSVLFDTRRAVLLSHTQVAKVDNPSDGRRFFGLELSGRINRSPDRAQVLYLFDADGAAAIVSQLIGLAQRAGGEMAADFAVALEHRLAELPTRDEEEADA